MTLKTFRAPNLECLRLALACQFISVTSKETATVVMLANKDLDEASSSPWPLLLIGGYFSANNIFARGKTRPVLALFVGFHFQLGLHAGRTDSSD